ncbi:LPXTG cell wall anchor domain-containing protein [Streptomyces sp. NPDC090306]|uniref:LPXTG cell wall anchor domain-containing protein n=1 Tax=unclassified Streptomyces TaxID=2593676 RepID=UPI0036E95488
MSIARRVTAARLLGTGAAAVAICAASATGAWASDCPGGSGWKADGGHYKPGKGAGTVTEVEGCEFSLDGTSFYSSVKVDDQNLKPGTDGKAHITVRTADGASTCTVSIASYLTHGAYFSTSGQQVFHDFDSVTVKRGKTDTLDVAIPDVGCYAQVDLYKGAVKYDGDLNANDGFTHGDLPAGPDHAVIGDKLIAAWNGGTKDCTATQSESPSPSDTPTGTPTESAPSTPAGGETSESASPSDDTTTAPASDETSAAPAPAASSSTTAAAGSSTGGDTTGGDLAETGGGSNAMPITIGAAVLVAGGGALLIGSRRRRSSARS